MQNWADLVKPRVTVLPEARGEGLTYQRIWSWIAYPDVQPDVTIKSEEGETRTEPAVWWSPSFRGFRALILSNPTGGQVRRESETFRAYSRGQLTEPEYLETIAERVKAWEYRIIEDDGTKVDVPAPGADSWERFYDLPAGLLSWLVGEIRTVHFPKATTRAGGHAGTTDSTPPTSTSPATEPPTS